VIEAKNGSSVKLVPGKPGQFDVEVDGRVVFSKSEAGRFPDHDEVLHHLA
jgi:selT/selW/selH-like putative selenoprotein